MASLFFALLAGVLTVAAPCTLPVLPVILGASAGQAGRGRPAAIALGFVGSFAAVTVVFSAIREVSGVDPNTLRSLAILLLLGFGILMLWPQLYELMSVFVGARFSRDGAGPARSRQGILGGFVLGTTLGLVWTPCAGPVLGSILALLAIQADVGWAALLLLAYAVGAAIPMLAIAYGGQYVTTRIRRVAPFTRHLQRGFGVVVIGFAVAMYFQYDVLATAWLSDLYPEGRIGL